MSETPGPEARWCVVGRIAPGRAVDVGGPGAAGADPGAAGPASASGDRRWRIGAVDLAADGTPIAEQVVEPAGFAEFVAGRESADRPRWVWSDSPSWYPGALAAGVRVERAHDLRLCHAILRGARSVRDRDALAAAVEWDAASAASEPDSGPEPVAALFDLDEPLASPGEVPHDLDAALAEFSRQRAALASSEDPGRLALLLAAESAGGLIAVELRAAGVPWDADEHDRLLESELGPRPAIGAKPERMLRVADEVRTALGDARASLDSPPKLLSALRRAGIDVRSTSHWELEEHEHPAIEPLLRYKKLSRLLSANGWAWIDEWVRDGRYRPVYVPGGVVTGRWASSGGGALQLPRQLRPALRADPGWTLVSADVAQLEPRVLAAMSGDRAMAAAGFEKDLYSGIVESGIVSTRQDAKIAVLGAMYGGTSGDSGRLVPRLRRGFPSAMRLVDRAAEVGERGGVMATWLGRTSPPPAPEWAELQAGASLPGATSRDEERARRAAREFGRFTRNFVVQGTAAEWALAWLADLRLRLAAIGTVESGAAEATASGPAFARRPHLVFFLHDEVIVHTPVVHAEAVAAAVEASAVAAGRLLFGAAPVDFPLDILIAQRAVKE